MRCPLCGDSRKSSTKKRGWWYNQNASYYCFNCGTGMTGLKFLETISGQSFKDIHREYTKLFLGSSIRQASKIDEMNDEPSIFQLKSIINPDLKKPLSDKAINYLKERKVLDAPFLSDQLYTCCTKKSNEEYILIPWIINGCEAYYQLNDYQKFHSLKYIFPKNKKKLIAGLDNIDITWPYIICFEGFYDSVFVKNGVCLGTKAITDYQLKIIQERYPKHQIVISFDNDTAGIESTIRLLKKDNDFKFFKWFNQNTKQKDINDYILAKDNVNIFTDSKILEKLIVDRLRMKMYLIQNSLWKNIDYKKKEAFKTSIKYDKDPFWKTRKIQ